MCQPENGVYSRILQAAGGCIFGLFPQWASVFHQHSVMPHAIPLPNFLAVAHQAEATGGVQSDAGMIFGQYCCLKGP